MGTGTNIFDASFQQLERFRATAPGSSALVDKLNGPVDWINKNHGVMPVPQQVMPERKGGAVGGTLIQEYVVKRLPDEPRDVVVVKDSKGDDLFVALPYVLRRSPFDNLFREGLRITYTSAGIRLASSVALEVSERQRISMSYLLGDLIYVGTVGSEIMSLPEQVSGQGRVSVNLIDLNTDGRMWTAFIG